MQVGIDFIRPLPKTARGNHFITTLVDYFSKWPVAEGLPDKPARSVPLKLMCRYVIECTSFAVLYHVLFTCSMYDCVLLIMTSIYRYDSDQVREFVKKNQSLLAPDD